MKSGVTSKEKLVKSDSDSDSFSLLLNRITEKVYYLSEPRSCEKSRVEEGGREETAGGRCVGGGGERKEGEKLQ